MPRRTPPPIYTAPSLIYPIPEPLPHVHGAQQGLEGAVRQHADALAHGAHGRDARDDAGLEVGDGGLHAVCAARDQHGRVGHPVERERGAVAAQRSHLAQGGAAGWLK